MLALAHAWHQRCLADPEAQHPFSHPGLHPQHTERLAAYWGEMLGGPDAYSREVAPVAHMVRMHSGNGPHPELDAATERCFALALDDAGIPDDERLRSTLVDWFAWSNRVVNHTYERPELVPDEPAPCLTGRGTARSSSAPPVGSAPWMAPLTGDTSDIGAAFGRRTR